MTRTHFLIQRYSTSNWDYVKGLRPFLATGPAFMTVMQRGSLQRCGEHRPLGQLRLAIEQAIPAATSDWRDVVAEWMLREGIVQALWSISSPECVPPELRWRSSVEALAEETPKDGELVDCVIDFLSGLAGPEHFRSYVSEDSLELEACAIPQS